MNEQETRERVADRSDVDDAMEEAARLSNELATLRAENARLREAVEKATARLVCAYMMDEAELRESVAEEYDTLETAIKEPGV